jgi:hypothetical protein
MTFIRVKEIGKKHGIKYKYAYLVENKWRKRIKGGKKGSRQRVSKYLGKVVKLNKEKDISFFNFLKLSDINSYLEKSKAEIIDDLIRYELFLHGFEEKEGIMLKNELSLGFDIKRKRFVNANGKPENTVIEINEGFLCEHTILKLLDFKKIDDDDHYTGIGLAKAFLEAGLKVPEEIFVGYFNKI